MKKTLCSLTLLLTFASTQLQASTEILPLTTEKVQNMKLESIPAYPPELLLKGKQKNWMKIVHKGQVVVAIYESTAAKIDLKEPLPYDEFVQILEGRSILTHTNGEVNTYNKGDSFLIPKGWSGTWELSDNYREMVVIETNAWNNSEG